MNRERNAIRNIARVFPLAFITAAFLSWGFAVDQDFYLRSVLYAMGILSFLGTLCWLEEE